MLSLSIKENFNSRLVQVRWKENFVSMVQYLYPIPFHSCYFNVRKFPVISACSMVNPICSSSVLCHSWTYYLVMIPICMQYTSSMSKYWVSLLCTQFN